MSDDRRGEGRTRGREGARATGTTPADTNRSERTGARWQRRKFLARLGASALGCSLAGTAAKSLAITPEQRVVEDKWSIHRWGMGIDVERCIGCGSCVEACAEENHVPPEMYRTWVERYREYEDGTIVDSPHGGREGFSHLDESREPIRAFFVPKLCNACQESPCSQVCPVGATFETPDGAVLIDPEYCIGCRYCIQACPYGCRFINPVTNTADKCSMCYHRIHKGLDPACVHVCPTGARIFGDLKDPESPVSKFLHSHKTFVLKPHLNTYPKVYYHGIDREVR